VPYIRDTQLESPSFDHPVYILRVQVQCLPKFIFSPNWKTKRIYKIMKSRFHGIFVILRVPKLLAKVIEGNSAAFRLNTLYTPMNLKY